VREGHFDQSIYGSLASDGFRISLYDQAGSGMSDFLPKVSEGLGDAQIHDYSGNSVIEASLAANWESSNG
jgi:hypothetical protein